MDKGKRQKRSAFQVFGQKEQPFSEEDLKTMVAGNAELLDDEKRMIGEILNLGDMSVREIMTPRVDMMLVEDTETVRHALERMRGTGYSRLPVFHEDCDDILGIVHYKDLITPLMDGRLDDPIADYACEALFVPESKDVFPLLAEMQTKRQQMAIVVDEYGGTDGLITMEDIIEEIVGDIADETDRISTMLLQIGDGMWMADGRCAVEDVIKLGWPLEESDDYETLAGWLMSKMDTVPKPGEQLDFQGYRFKIVAMRRMRISKVRVQLLDDSALSADTAAAVEEGICDK